LVGASVLKTLISDPSKLCTESKDAADTSFFQQLLNAETDTTSFPDLELPCDWSLFDPNNPVSPDTFEQLFDPMTFKVLTDVPMQQNDECSEQIDIGTNSVSSSSLITPATHDDTTTSSMESTSDVERDDINRRGVKKSGGPVRKMARFGNKSVVKFSDEYHDRRIKNNEAVKKSRLKSKEKQKDTEGKMSKLADENRTLSDRVDLLMKELQVLKSLYKELNQDLPVDAVKALERINVR